MATEEVRKDPATLGEFIVEKKIDWATIPPVMAQIMDEDKLKVLKKLFLAGEAPPAELMERASKLMDVYNAIGKYKEYTGGVFSWYMNLYLNH